MVLPLLRIENGTKKTQTQFNFIYPQRNRRATEKLGILFVMDAVLNLIKPNLELLHFHYNTDF